MTYTWVRPRPLTLFFTAAAEASADAVGASLSSLKSLILPGERRDLEALLSALDALQEGNAVECEEDDVTKTGTSSRVRVRRGNHYFILRHEGGSDRGTVEVFA